MFIWQRIEGKSIKASTNKKMKNTYIQTYIDQEMKGIIRIRLAIPKINLKTIKGAITNRTPRIRKNPCRHKGQF